MTSIQIASNPFAQMMDPQAVIAAVERSARLQGLQSRVCRPLDKPLGPTAEAEAEAGGAGGETAAFDASLDAASEPDGAASEPDAIADSDSVRT